MHLVLGLNYIASVVMVLSNGTIKLMIIACSITNLVISQLVLINGLWIDNTGWNVAFGVHYVSSVSFLVCVNVYFLTAFISSTFSVVCLSDAICYRA